MKTKLPWLLPLVFTVWMILTLVPLSLVQIQLPVLVTNLMSISILPFLPLMPVFKFLHLTSGDSGYSLPTSFGLTIGVLFYDLVLYFLGRAIKNKL